MFVRPGRSPLLCVHIQDIQKNLDISGVSQRNISIRDRLFSYPTVEDQLLTLESDRIILQKAVPEIIQFFVSLVQIAPVYNLFLVNVVPQKAIVTVSQQSHPRYEEEGTIEADTPNHWQQIVTFADGERILINNADLDAASVPFPRERTYPAEYSEALAAIEERHKQELERLSQELRIGLQTEATARAEAQVQEQLSSLQRLFKQQKEQNIQLQQRLDEMEGLRKLEIENQQLQQRIQELEHSVQQHPVQQWGNTMTQQATKVLNKQVKQALEKTID